MVRQLSMMATVYDDFIWSASTGEVETVIGDIFTVNVLDVQDPFYLSVFHFPEVRVSQDGPSSLVTNHKLSRSHEN